MTKKRINLSNVLITLAVAFLNVIIVIFPKETIEASKAGVGLWLETVLPSLLPFTIGANILYATGVTGLAGKLFEPLTQFLWGVPGEGAFVLISGMLSGYPTGAVTVGDLRKNGDISKTEAQRLISFVNNAGPLFIIGAVGVGMFGNVYIGYFILTTHYISAIVVGFIFRFYKRSFASVVKKKKTKTKEASFKSIGTILSQSVVKSMETMLLVGGFIILFRVVIEALNILGFFSLFPEFASNIFSGAIELANGCEKLADSGTVKLSAIAVAVVISFGGFSVHTQSLAFISKTDISTVVYLLSKFLHAIIAAIVGSILYPLFNSAIEHMRTVEASSDYLSAEKSRISMIIDNFSTGAMLFGIMIVIVIVAAMISRMTVTRTVRK